ncbi:InlB B-repeat-containing protein, partial [Fibrobacter sp.]|uniref:InlB B-repeat-containing protein n=1 Tax=Fibrobacter sp. TaxID=35828 RepID=UPI0025B8B81D
MTSNSNFPFRSVRLGLAFIFILFMAVASWATDVTYTYTMSWKENVLRYTGTITSNTGEISNNFSSDNRVDNVLLKGNESASITEEYFSIKFACFRDVYKGSVNNTFRVTHSDAEFTITINNKNNNSYKIRKVTFKKSDGEEITSVTHVSTQSSASVALLPNTEFSTIVVELTDKPYYSVTPAEGLAISNTDGFVVDGTTYFHPATTITIAPTSAVQVITATNGTENTATIASDKRSFSFAMPSQAITPSATLEEAHVVALSDNVSISEPLFTYDGDSYYKSGDKITITATKTNEIIDGITGIADYAIAADKKSATFTMPTSDLTLVATTSEVHTVSVPTNLTISKEYITIGSIKYYKTGVTYTLAVANATHMIDEITGVTSSIAADKRSATFKMPSGNATIAATTYEVHSISVPNALSISSDPYATVGVSKYYKTGTKITLSLAADDLNRVIKTFNASGAVSPSIAEGLRSATLTVGAQDITVSATLLTIGGTCGSGTTWRMTDEDKNGTFETLNIGGTGALVEYANGKAPWYSDFRTTITRVNIGNDITTIPANPFYGIGDGAPIVLSTPALALKFKDAAFASKLRVPFGNYLFKATETTDNKPAYDIAIADDLRHLAAAVKAGNSGSGKTFFQTADIDLASVDNFKPIGYADSTTFAGNYDGNRHVVSGLKVSGSLNYAGLFGTVSGEIKNVILMNPSVSSSNNGADVGAIIGKLTGNASNCYFYGGNRSNAIGKMSKSAEVSNVSQAYTLKVAEHISGDKLADDPENGFQYDADNDGTPENYYRDGLELTLSHDETVVEPTETGYALTYLLDGQKSSNISGSTLTVGSATDGKTLSAAIRSDGLKYEITYIDANGTEKNAQAISLDGTESTLKAGWYFVGRDIAYDHALSLSETVTFILGDGKTMNVDATSSEAIFAERNFTIYGQSGQSGILKASAKGQNSKGIINTSGDIVIRGGNVTATGESFGIKGHKNITISGGKVSATGGKYGIYSYGNITLSWTNSTDNITASSYKLGSNAGHVIIPNGKYLKDADVNVYSGTLDNQLSAIAGKTLTPAIPVKYIDEDGKEQTIYNYTVLTNDIKPDKYGYISLAGGWYVVEGAVSYTNTVKFSEDAYLILADGAKMEIKTDGYMNNGIDPEKDLTIYGQMHQSGILLDSAKGNRSSGINCYESVKIVGGNVTTFGKRYGIYGSEVLITGGDITATGDNQGVYSYGGNITISGGGVTATSESGDGIYSEGGDIVISGGSITATSKKTRGLSSTKNVTINGGSVTIVAYRYGIFGDNVSISDGDVSVSSEILYGIYGYSNVSISGGSITATGEKYGIYSYGDIILGWTAATDSIKASSYYFNDENHVIIAEDKTFKDEKGDVYTGTLNDDQIQAIAGKTLTPCYAVALDLQDGKDPVKLPATFDKNGVAHVTKPDDPTRSGFNFLGWFTAKDGDTEFDFSAAITANMTAYAKWSVPYIDEDGNEKVRKPGEYTVLTSTTDVSSLTGGWFVVEGKVRYTNTVKFGEDASLILADGAEMTVEISSGDAIHADKNLSIYGQSGRSGILAATSEYNNGISIGGEITIAGGNVTISGGNVSSDNEYGFGINSHGDVTITGGNVTATSGGFYGIYSDVGNISLSWNNSADNIKVDGGFRFNSDAAHVIIPEGKAFTDEDGKVYSGTLTNEQVKAINYKSLSPFTGIFVAFVDKQGDKEVTVAAIPVDENGHVAAPYEPMRNGYTFMGWYTTADGDTEFNFANITASTTAYAKWEENALVKYIDENGKTKSTKDYVLLTSNMDVSNLPDGWYVVKGEVSYTSSVCFGYDAHLILADGAKMTVEVSSRFDAILAKNSLAIYGQSGQSGILVATAQEEPGSGIYGNNVIISGGNITATGIGYGIYGNNVIISGGSVTATGDFDGIYSYSGVTITGGNVTATGSGISRYGIYSAYGDISLSWTNRTDAVKASSYYLGSSEKHVTIAEGKAFTDENGNVYRGTLTKEQLSAIKDKKLMPCYAVALDLQDGKAPVMLPAALDENGVAHVAKPDDPTRSGFNFLGWFTAKDGDTEFDFSAAITANTTAYAKWSINYIDENGNEKSVADFTVLTKNMDVGSLTGGWYVVEGEVSYSNTVKFSDDAYLILVDDSKLTVDVANGSAVFVSGSLSIYGQSGQSGILETTAGEDGSGIAIDGDIMISGVVVKATGAWGGINSNRVTINGGSVTATNEIGYGIYAYDGDITLSWTNSSDSIKASSYSLHNSEKHVIIADGKSFKDEDGNVYSGTLNDEQLSAIKGKKLMPCYAVTLDLQDGKAPVMLPATLDENGVAHVAKPDDPTRSGFNFLGWYNADGITKFDFSAAITANTTAYAKWSVNYIDENGIEKSVADFTVLTNDIKPEEYGVISLPGGWYVAEGEVSYTNTVVFSNDAYLILADGAKLEIKTEGEFERGIDAFVNLTIYGQSGQSGILADSAKGSHSAGIYSSHGNVTISGGNVTVTGVLYGICSYEKAVTISGGNVTVTGGLKGIVGNNYVTISGGNVTATGSDFGIYSYKNITLGWTNSTDRIWVSLYGSNVVIA